MMPLDKEYNYGRRKGKDKREKVREVLLPQ